MNQMPTDTEQPLVMQVQKRSRGVRPVGEVFRIKLPRNQFLMGRVIRNDCDHSYTDPIPREQREKGWYLVYIYKKIYKDELLNETPNPDDVLRPLFITNPTPWTRGYFQPLRVEPVEPWLREHWHVFGEGQTIRPPRFFDEFGNLRSKPSFDVASRSPNGYLVVDYKIAQNLGAV